MGLMETNRTHTNVVRSYAPGAVRVGETVHATPFCLGPEGVAPLEASHPLELGAADLASLLDPKPELVIIGWSGGQFFLPAAQRAWFLERRIGVETMELGAACRTYNVLVQDGRDVRAMLFPR